MVETKSICTVLALFLFSIYFFLSVDVFGFENSTWDLGEDMHTNRTEITGECDGGFLEGKTTTDKMLIYDPETNEWSEGTPLPSPRAAAVAEVVNGSIYLISGPDIENDPVKINEVPVC